MCMEKLAEIVLQLDRKIPQCRQKLNEMTITKKSFIDLKLEEKKNEVQEKMAEEVQKQEQELKKSGSSSGSSAGPLHIDESLQKQLKAWMVFDEVSAREREREAVSYTHLTLPTKRIV